MTEPMDMDEAIPRKQHQAEMLAMSRALESVENYAHELRTRLRQNREAVQKAADKVRAVEKQMHDAPYDYAELIGDWHEELRFAVAALDKVLKEGT